MSTQKLPEVWLRGQVKNVPPLLQPVAHALLQAREEVIELMKDFPDEVLWTKPGGTASVGFHLQHLSGVLDRLYTYSKGGALSDGQHAALKAEGTPPHTKTTSAELVESFSQQVDKALEELQHIDEETLTEHRAVGRAQLPSTIMGLLFHSAEHTMRHLGQLIVTVRLLKAKP